MVKALLATAALAVLATATQAKAPDKPNIIVIMLDDVPDDLTIMPRVSALLPTGTRYENSFTNQPLCGPSRATFLTGQESPNHGVTSNGAFLSDLSGLVPQALRAAGYTTGMFGKNPNGYGGSAGTLGFDRWSIVMQINKRRYVDPKLDINGTPTEFPPDTYTTDAIYSEAEAWIAESRAKPYFAWISAVGGHGPNIPAPRYEDACDEEPFSPGPAFNEPDDSDKPSFIQALPPVKEDGVASNWRRRCATIQADDEWIDRIVRRFAATNTCIFFTSDNGFLHGQHKTTGKNLLYEESIRVPLVLWGCGASSGTDARLVSNVDLPATFLELAGASPGRPLDGQSLFSEEPRRRIPLLGIWSGKSSDPQHSSGYRRKNSVIWRHSNGECERYDIKADPYQLENLC